MYYQEKNDHKKMSEFDRLISKKIFRGLLVSTLGLLGIISFQFFQMPVHADASSQFEVNVVGTLSVSVTTPSSWASGDIDTFLRNKVTLTVTTNDTNGFTASMYSQNTTDLVNESKRSVVLPTLSASTTRGNFPSNYWGYSLKTESGETLNGKTYNETDAGNNNSNYHALVATSSSPITVLQTSSGGSPSGSRDIYFGAKANAGQAAGTYSGTVLISVVTGTVVEPSNPITPTNPATNGDTTPGNARYDSVNDRTVYYTTSSTVDTETSTAEVSERNVTSAYSNPAGVTKSANINGSTLALGLATAISMTVASSTFFFILAKRREEDEDDEEENQ